jgi:hypothetical protein
VAFSIQANTGAARAGTLTVAGQTFTVNQAAGAPDTVRSVPRDPGLSATLRQPEAPIMIGMGSQVNENRRHVHLLASLRPAGSVDAKAVEQPSPAGCLQIRLTAAA